MKGTLAWLSVAVLLTGCGSVPVWKDETPVVVEALVKTYGPDTMHMDFADGRSSTTHLFVSELEVVSPAPRFERRLHIWSLRELDRSNPLTHAGARVSFTVPRKYLVEILSDPKKKHDLPFLYMDSVTDLREIQKMPNQVPEPMSGLAPGHGSS